MGQSRERAGPRGEAAVDWRAQERVEEIAANARPNQSLDEQRRRERHQRNGTPQTPDRAEDGSFQGTRARGNAIGSFTF